MIRSTILKQSAGHDEARCMNRQKAFHDAEPTGLPAGRIAKQCHCGQWYSLPICHAARHKSCSVECSKRRTSLRAQARAKPCQQCGELFIPRPNQERISGAKFCSIACSGRFFRLSAAGKEVARRSGETYRASLAAGKFIRPTGKSHPQWQGGQKAAVRRQIESGKAAARLREYRSENPHKAREWAQNRRCRLRGMPRLPRGTIPRLYELQKGKCAHCCARLPSDYHVDHIHPLAKGGLHEPGNLQLLCPPCNVRKSDKDPIRYAQESGRLL